jgi:hypothetical protein
MQSQRRFVQTVYQGRSLVEQRMLRALMHFVHRNHDFSPRECQGCLEAAGFLTLPGYEGSDEPLVY